MEKDLEKLAEKIAEQNQTYIEKFIKNDEIINLIKKLLSQHKTVDEIVKILNKMLKDKDIRERFNIPLNRKVVIYRKHIHRLFNNTL